VVVCVTVAEPPGVTEIGREGEIELKVKGEATVTLAMLWASNAAVCPRSEKQQYPPCYGNPAKEDGGGKRRRNG